MAEIRTDFVDYLSHLRADMAVLRKSCRDHPPTPERLRMRAVAADHKNFLGGEVLLQAPLRRLPSYA